jgi:hypothetical protein
MVGWGTVVTRYIQKSVLNIGIANGRRSPGRSFGIPLQQTGDVDNWQFHLIFSMSASIYDNRIG